VRSRTDYHQRLTFAAAVLTAVLSFGASGRAQVTSPDTNQPTEAEISRALDTVKADPNLATLRTIKMLRWKDSGAPKPAKIPTWVTWLAELFRWFDQTARVLVWGLAAVLAVFLMGYIASLVQRRRDVTGREPGLVAPSRVFDLDIRPESLPDDIGAAARRLWDRAEHRAALALLYRGLLSRLAHVHQVPIRDSSTEGDCLALAARHLPPVKSEYASRLVGAWQRAIYGCEDLQTDIVHRLCDGFSSTLDEPSPLGTAT
jgi:Domain of unknown function (DUF4129)